MIVGLVFGALGFVCGLGLRLVGFAVLLAIAVAGYACVRALSGPVDGTLALDALIAVVAMQVGYFVAVLLRIAMRRLRPDRLATSARQDNAETGERSPLSGRVGKPFP